MIIPPFFIFEEHSQQQVREERSLADLLKDSPVKEKFTIENLDYLCIDQNLQAHYFIGMRWVEYHVAQAKLKGVIWVNPKHDKIPFEKLLFTCLTHPIVSNHLEECYEIFPHEAPIPLPVDFEDFLTPLLITDFLVRVKKIVKKGLKKGFINVRETMKNRVKGKILINPSRRIQLKKNTVTQTHCSYQVHSVNCMENRILKAALIQSQRYAYRFLKNKKQIKDLLHYNLIAFEEVNTVSITPSDFSLIHNSAFYKEYKMALSLAKLILKMEGFSINSDIPAKKKTIPPFYINMPELFERYCEVLLRKQYPDLRAGYQYDGYSETRLGKSMLRPDFIIPSINTIVDSKYKYWIMDKNDNDGLMQLSLYSRHEKALEMLNNEGKLPLLQIIYPNSSGPSVIKFDSEENEKLDEFIEIYEYPLSITSEII